MWKKLIVIAFLTLPVVALAQSGVFQQNFENFFSEPPEEELGGGMMMDLMEGDFVKPPDVPDYVPVEPTYAAGTTLNVIGDGSPRGGTPPAAAYELENIPTPNRLDWTVPAEGLPCETTLTGGGCTEAKARFLAESTHILFDDPIRNYGQPGTSHCHQFFGNGSTNAYSTYASLREHGNTALFSGGANNATGYWEPCLIKKNAFGDGKDYVVRPNGFIVYYSDSPQASLDNTYLPIGLRYVGGYNMDDGDEWLQSKIDAANSQPGTAFNRYSLDNGGNRAVVSKWICSSNGSQSATLTDDEGNDLMGNCAPGPNLRVEFLGPRCWDGVNLWSPGGYHHVIPGVYDSFAEGFVCPNGWWKLPALSFQAHFSSQGAADYTTWQFSSDMTVQENTPEDDYVPAGATFHTDWMFGWDGESIGGWQFPTTGWLNFCLGIGNDTPRECDGSIISATEILKTSQPSPNGRANTVNPYHDWGTSDPANMFLLPSDPRPETLHVHGTN
ncbi:MAG: DUF1996 domain-containing protein [Candidatus Moraniibacteriota bacterium]